MTQIPSLPAAYSDQVRAPSIFILNHTHILTRCIIMRTCEIFKFIHACVQVFDEFVECLCRIALICFGRTVLEGCDPGQTGTSWKGSHTRSAGTAVGTQHRKEWCNVSGLVPPFRSAQVMRARAHRGRFAAAGPGESAIADAFLGTWALNCGGRVAAVSTTHGAVGIATKGGSPGRKSQPVSFKSERGCVRLAGGAEM